jgi:hypothetical protein
LQNDFGAGKTEKSSKNSKLNAINKQPPQQPLEFYIPEGLE